MRLELADVQCLCGGSDELFKAPVENGHNTVTEKSHGHLSREVHRPYLNLVVE
jgi:hypothetical protein